MAMASTSKWMKPSWAAIKTAGQKRSKGSNKTYVFGMVERDCNLRAGPIPNVPQDTLEFIVRGHVKEGTRITADELNSYNDLSYGFDLGRVNHSKKEWVVGVHHTNTIEAIGR